MRSSIALITGPIVLGLLLVTTAMADTSWPARVLITNDNGIDDPGIVELALGLSEVAEVYVVAPDTDRSGSSNFMGAVRSRRFEVEPRDLGPGITAFALDGYPADCVVFALSGPMRDTLPDLVVSGINGGPNLGDGWFGSGTIGAARAAAYFGFRAIALSGLDDGNPHAVKAVVDWVVRFTRSEAVQSLQPPQYLTVSFPLVDPWEIEGVEIVPRARGLVTGGAKRVGGTFDTRQTWELSIETDPTRAAMDSDVAAASRNNIAIVTMRADESDVELAAKLKGRLESIPSWVAPARPEEPECRPGLGMMISDAEDETGREWGVRVAEIMAGGVGEQVGLRVDDVIVSVNGEDVGTSRGSREDPVEIFVRVLTQLDCGDPVVLEYEREGLLDRVEFVVSTRE